MMIDFSVGIDEVAAALKKMKRGLVAEMI